MTRELINPGASQATYDNWHFSQATKVGDTIWVSGQTGIGPDGAPAEGTEAQTRLAFEGLASVLEAAGASLVGISVDSAFCHGAFREKLGITIPLLADFHPKGAVCDAYGALIAERGHANRSLVLVGPEGDVEWSYAAPTPLEIPGANLIFDALAAAAA